jgi:hypothetical protein
VDAPVERPLREAAIRSGEHVLAPDELAGSSFALMSGAFTIAEISRCSRSTIAFGVPAGTNTMMSSNY